MAKVHGTKEVKRLFRQMERLGFEVVNIKNVFRITPPPHIKGRIYTTHGTPKSVKAIYSDFRKLYGVELDPLWMDK